MKEFFKVHDIADVFGYFDRFEPVATEPVDLSNVCGRIAAADILADESLPDFPRSIVDGFAVRGTSTFGASETNPAYIAIGGKVDMGKVPRFSIGPGEAARIPTGGMLPDGTDSVVMVEHTGVLDETTIEIYRSVAPGQNCIGIGEDYQKGAVLVSGGQVLRPQHAGVLAAFGRTEINVYRRPMVGIISTGDEIVDVTDTPAPGQIRDINTHTIAGLVTEAGGVPVPYGIVADHFDALSAHCDLALKECDTVLISGGSSVGTRDYTVEVIGAFETSEIMVHGISISPGKPTILAAVGGQAFWGLPGHVVSAMIVFDRIVKPFIRHIGGLRPAFGSELKIPATLRRNVPSVHGRMDYVRVKLASENGVLQADPLLGKSALIHTIAQADGLIEIDKNTEGLDKGDEVQVIPF
jgi:molybdopterin molybdotransferase